MIIRHVVFACLRQSTIERPGLSACIQFEDMHTAHIFTTQRNLWSNIIQAIR